MDILDQIKPLIPSYFGSRNAVCLIGVVCPSGVTFGIDRDSTRPDSTISRRDESNLTYWSPIGYTALAASTISSKKKLAWIDPTVIAMIDKSFGWISRSFRYFASCSFLFLTAEVTRSRIRSRLPSCTVYVSSSALLASNGGTLLILQGSPDVGATASIHILRHPSSIKMSGRLSPAAIEESFLGITIFLLSNRQQVRYISQNRDSGSAANFWGN